MSEDNKVVYTNQQLMKFVKEYEAMDEEELLDVIRNKTEELGRPPKRAEIPAAYYFKHKYGAWPRVLETAGVKEISETYLRRKIKRAERRRRK